VIPYFQKNPSPKRVGGVAQGVGLEFKSHTAKKNPKKPKHLTNTKRACGVAQKVENLPIKKQNKTP
jgi:signal recognition particle subunit SEC65